MSPRAANRATGICVFAFFLALWAFFQFGCPAHLAMKERSVMLLWDSSFLSSYFSHPGCVSVLIGDAITQFFTIPCVAPLLTTALLLAVWAGLRLCLKALRVPAPALLALIPIAAEAILTINTTYPIAMTVGALIAVWCFAACSLIRSGKARICAQVAVTLAAITVSVAALRENSCNINLKSESFSPEKELDYKIYLLACNGRWEKVLEIGLSNPYRSRTVSYYYNVALARDGKLPEGLLKAYQPLYHGLFIPVKPGTTFFQQIISIDALRTAGDYSQAQHSAMLALTFSPRQRSARMLRELSDLAFANGDYDAAKRYLQMLKKTALYRKWAQDGLDLLQEQSSLAVPNDYSDILFSHNDYRESLSVIARSATNGRTATDYLLCLDLLDKDLQSFRADYDRFYHGRFDIATVPEIYQEALLMTFDEDLNPDRQLAEYHIESRTLERCSSFLKGHEKEQIHSFWFYHKYAQPA